MQRERVFTPPNSSPSMSSPVFSVVNVPAVLDDSSPERINPATLSKIGSMTHNRKESGYNLEWESRAEFNTWLSHEQAALGIEIQVSKTQESKARQLYSTCKTLRCAHNRTGGKSHYVKKTTHVRKIN